MKDNVSTCPVCFESLDTRIRTVLTCQHDLCLNCLVRITPRRCPICRNDFSLDFPSDFPTNSPQESSVALTVRTESLIPIHEIVRRLHLSNALNAMFQANTPRLVSMERVDSPHTPA